MVKITADDCVVCVSDEYAREALILENMPEGNINLVRKLYDEIYYRGQIWSSVKGWHKEYPVIQDILEDVKKSKESVFVNETLYTYEEIKSAAENDFIFVEIYENFEENLDKVKAILNLNEKHLFDELFSEGPQAGQHYKVYLFESLKDSCEELSEKINEHFVYNKNNPPLIAGTNTDWSKSPFEDYITIT